MGIALSRLFENEGVRNKDGSCQPKQDVDVANLKASLECVELPSSRLKTTARSTDYDYKRPSVSSSRVVTPFLRQAKLSDCLQKSHLGCLCILDARV